MSYVIADADVLIDLAEQTLTLPKKNKFYLISSGKNGIGEVENSGKTPRGWHLIAEKHGAEQPQNADLAAGRWLLCISRNMSTSAEPNSTPVSSFAGEHFSTHSAHQGRNISSVTALTRHVQKDVQERHGTM